MRKWTFDKIVHGITKQIPYLGKPLWKYYVKHGWFSRTAKFIVTTSILFWVVKGPLISILNGFLPPVNMLFIIVPSYLLAAFFAGIIVTVMGVIFNEIWIYRR